MMLDFIQENNFSEPGMPRYRALAGVLRSGILSGRLADGTKFPPEAEFAAMLGINHRTLRAGLKLLADECLISQSRGRGTFVTYARKKHLKVGVLLGDPHTLTNDIYMLRLLAGLSQAIDNNPDSELHFMTSPEPEKVFELLQRRECHALIVLDRDPAMACRLCRSEFKSMPIIFVNPQSSELAEDNRYEVDIAPGGAADCVRYLYDLGHRKIGFISACGTLDLRVATQNREFTETCCELGISSSYQRLLPPEVSWYDPARKAARELFSEPDCPTALFCPGFVFSYGAWQGLLEIGLRIPEDVSLLGFDSNTNSNPHLSSLDAPLNQLAAQAVELAFALQSDGKHRKEHFRLIPRTLVERGSCRRLNTASIKK